MIPPIKCINCKTKDAELEHHIIYEKNITVPVCSLCHQQIHKNPKHRFYPIDKRTEETYQSNFLSERKTISISCRIPTQLLIIFDKLNTNATRTEKIIELVKNYVETRAKEIS